MPQERAHARLGPSSASRWLRCLGSVNFIEEVGEDEAGVAADEGTILHSFCEDCLRDDLNPFDLVGEKREYNGYEYTLTDDDAEQILKGLDYIDDIPGKLFIEKRLDLGRWMPGQFGTMDVGIANKKRAVLFDWKWGFLPVQAVDNDQLRIYALGFWDNFLADRFPDLEEFRLVIWQPRALGGGGEWDVSLDELLDFGKYVKKQARRTYDKDAPRTPGEAQCAYCPGARKRLCPEYEKFNLDMIVADFDEMDESIEYDLPMRTPNVRLITPERRSFIVKHRSMINKFLDRLHAETLDDALKGLPTPGLKAVEGRSPPRKWKDNETAEARLKALLPEEDVYTRKVISPTQAEKELPEKQYAKLKRLVDHGEKKPVLVPSEDAREPVSTIIDLFDED